MPATQELGDLIVSENLTIHFQPIISLKQQAVVGLEALARPGSSPGCGPLNVLQLFRMAQEEKRLLELDRLCRRKALNTYRGLASLPEPKPLLFVNFEASVIDQGVEGSGAIRQAVKESGLSPEDVVIEINESRVVDSAGLKRFVDRHRDQGFLIALDDLGTGESNLPRVAALRPHILKLDRSLVAGIDGDYFKQETFKCLVSLGHGVGCLILAEGVETQAEVDVCASLGAELFQGFNFSRALPADGLHLQALSPAIHAAGQRQRESAVKAIHARGAQALNMRRLSDTIRGTLVAAAAGSFDTVLERVVRTEPQVECAYMLDHNGIQVTETHKSPFAALLTNRLFSPAPKGTDHSNKEYFYSLVDAKLERYITENYLSLATGRHCRTVSSLVDLPGGESYALCLDLSADD
ncbi:MAG TPA: EAL domain-containing protein [bacterium]|jgi:EAL domain-containing protein (putative c-di-GMP-specific phosphodiesterase class I)|nr:EAL domain-containing protein [bacterium]